MAAVIFYSYFSCLLIRMQDTRIASRGQTRGYTVGNEGIQLKAGTAKERLDEI